MGKKSGAKVRRRPSHARDAGTLETRAKLRPNYLESLQRAGRLSSTQFQAAIELRDAFEFVTRPVALKISDPARLPGPGRQEDVENRRLDRLWGHYTIWAKEMQRRGINYFAVVDVLVYGKTCSTLDWEYRVRKGAAVEMLSESLAIYCDLQGWPIAA